MKCGVWKRRMREMEMEMEMGGCVGMGYDCMGIVDK